MGAKIRGLTLSQHEALLDEAIATAPAAMRPVLHTGKACFFTAHGMQERAIALLKTIPIAPVTDDVAIDFHGVTRGSIEMVEFLSNLPSQNLSSYGVDAAYSGQQGCAICGK